MDTSDWGFRRDVSLTFNKGLESKVGADFKGGADGEFSMADIVDNDNIAYYLVTMEGIKGNNIMTSSAVAWRGKLPKHGTRRKSEIKQIPQTL